MGDLILSGGGGWEILGRPMPGSAPETIESSPDGEISELGSRVTAVGDVNGDGLG